MSVVGKVLPGQTSGFSFHCNLCGYIGLSEKTQRLAAGYGFAHLRQEHPERLERTEECANVVKIEEQTP